jgi:hypothetical protein
MRIYVSELARDYLNPGVAKPAAAALRLAVLLVANVITFSEPLL